MLNLYDIYLYKHALAGRGICIVCSSALCTVLFSHNPVCKFFFCYTVFQWSSINELNKLQNLEELQLAGNPIIKTHNLETVRQLLVAKLGNAKLISRTPVSDSSEMLALTNCILLFTLTVKI